MFSAYRRNRSISEIVNTLSFSLDLDDETIYSELHQVQHEIGILIIPVNFNFVFLSEKILHILTYFFI